MGPSTIEFISKFQPDYLLTGIGAISLGGELFDYDYEEAMLMNRMMKNARQVILVTDGSKFEKTAIAKVGNLRDVAYLVTDKTPPEKICRLMARHNVSLIVPE